MREYGNCGSGYVYNDHTPDLPRTGTEGAPRERVLRPSPIVLLDTAPRVAARRPRLVTRALPAKKGAPRPRPGRTPQATPESVTAEIVRRHRAGESVRSIRADLGIGYERVTEALRQHGIEPTKSRRRPDQDWLCRECNRQMRPWNADPAKWPEGAVVHAGRDQCVACRARERKRLAREGAA